MLHTFCEITNAEDIVWTQRVLENLFDKAFNAITKYGGRVVIACLFIFIGFKLTKFVTKILRKTFELRSIDASVSSFLLSLITIVLKVLVLLTAVTLSKSFGKRCFRYCGRSCTARKSYELSWWCFGINDETVQDR